MFTSLKKKERKSESMQWEGKMHGVTSMHQSNETIEDRHRVKKSTSQATLTVLFVAES